MSIVVEMQSIGRPRQYVSSVRLYAMFPLLRFSYERGAYVLRFVGETRGPVLRKDRRRRQQEFGGADRRAGGVDLLASRPVGNVRRIKPGDVTGRIDSDDVAGGTDSGEAARRDTVSRATPARVPNTKRSRAQQTRATPRRRPEGRQRPPRPHH
jgi:hypothetical protein